MKEQENPAEQTPQSEDQLRGPDIKTDSKADTSKTRERLRSLIIGTLAASGAFQLNGWQVQAHGNRSSHSVAGLRTSVFRPEDFVLMRQELRAPNAGDTLALGMVTRQLSDGLAAGASPTNAQTIAALINQKAQLESNLKLGRMSQDVVNLLRQNDIDGVTAAIEGAGEPERVLDEYLWTLLDIAYLGRQGTNFTDQTLTLFSPVAQRANAYCQKILASLPKQDNTPGERYLKIKIAEITHNIASFAIPDQGTSPPDLLALGQEMALLALQLRQELNLPYETTIANWMVGKYYLAQRNFPAAKQYLQMSIDQATALNDLTSVAWGKTTLAAVLRTEIASAGAGPLPPGTSPDQVAALDKDARDLLDKIGTQSALSNLLLLERPN